MDCHHYDAGRCRSCTWLETPYADQLSAKQEHCASLLADQEQLFWEATVTGPESGFRNKAKMVVTGSVDRPALGILGPDGTGVDLQDCGLHEPAVRDALPVIAAFITRARLTPYDVAARRGELKYVLVTGAPSGDLMVRFVCRSQEPVARLRKHLAWLQSELPQARVVSVNLQPEHKAIVEGPDEVLLTENNTLAMAVNEIELYLRPQSFFQTNTTVAAALYREAGRIADALGPGSLWDLYCGVGGFALHLAKDGRAVTGIESSADAIESARATRDRLQIGRVDFVTGDATGWALAQQTAPDLVVVNPPRRGIGAELAGWLDRSAVEHVLYSSCNPTTLAFDIAAMPGLRARTARVFDMFPQTAHAEVLVLLERR